MRFRRLVWTGFLAVVCVSWGAAATVDLAAAKDNTLYAESGDLSNGAGDYLFAGSTGNGANRRILIKFDLAAILPPGVTITGASLKLFMDKTTAGTNPVDLHRMTSDWGEGTSDAAENEGQGAAAATGDATWTSPFNSDTLWTTEGGDFAEPVSATASVAGFGFYTWTSAQLTTDVQNWFADVNPNFGWILIGNEASSGTAKRFASRTNPTIANQPLLSVTYDTFSAVGNWTLY